MNDEQDAYWTDIEMRLNDQAELTERDKEAMKAVIKALFDNKRPPPTTANTDRSEQV